MPWRPVSLRLVLVMEALELTLSMIIRHTVSAILLLRSVWLQEITIALIERASL